MKLSELLSDIIAIPMDRDVTITSLCLSSRDVEPGSLFFAYPGEKVDGRDFIDEAIKKGARAILQEGGNHSCSQTDIVTISIPNLQHNIGPIAAKFYDYPARSMTIIGVTGTSGKTSVTNMIGQLLNQLGVTTYVIGSLGIGKPEGPFIETGINTPDPIRLHHYFAYLKEQGGQAIVMEVSSHALVQGRPQGVHFDVAIFTNLSRDHLDYHKTMEDYAAAKERLLRDYSVDAAIFNTEDTWSHGLYQRYQKTSLKCYGYSAKTTPIQLHQTLLVGAFNRENLLAAVTCLLILGYDEKTVLSCLDKVKPIPGRLEVIRREGSPCCVIDYAHKPDALEKVLIAVREITSEKLYCIFGCGGDRDKGKRPLMAAIAERYADVVCITDDNPRTETSEDILNDILKGFKRRENVWVISDRAKAIETMVHHASLRDTILIAGKGHEDYQMIGKDKKYFSDKAIVEKALKNIVINHKQHLDD